MNLKSLSRQELFNKAYLGMRSQNFVPSVSGGVYKYRNQNGTCCVIGHIIPDELYDVRFEMTILHKCGDNPVSDLFNKDDLDF